MKIIIFFFLFVILQLTSCHEFHVSSKTSKIKSSKTIISAKSLPSHSIASIDHKEDHKISILSLAINIIADLCPHGMLPLAYGFAQGPTGIVPAVLLLSLFGIMSGYTMTSYAHMANSLHVHSISQLWGKLFGEKTTIIADIMVFALCFGCLIFYSAFAGDIFGALGSAMKFPGLLSKRWVLLAIATTFLLTPLSLMDDLSNLQFSSILSAFCILFTVLAHVYRLFDGSYSITNASSNYLSSMSLKNQPHWSLPKFSLWNLNGGSLIFVNMLCVAYLAHYNSINYYEELKDRNSKRYKYAVTLGYGASLLVFMSLMFVGYDLFGKSLQPLILNNFHRTDDILATLARCTTGLSIIFAYPLMFAGLKSALKNIFISANGKSDKSSTTIDPLIFKGSQIAIISAITGIAFKCSEDDVSLVLGVVGSLLGCSVAYVIPALMKLKYFRLRKEKMLPNNRIEVVGNHVLAIVGVIFGTLGAYMTILDSSSHAHHE